MSEVIRYLSRKEFSGIHKEMRTVPKGEYVVFVRHAQSTSNRDNVYQSPDDPLTEEGEKQVEEVGKLLSGLEPDTILASPYYRTHATAQLLRQYLDYPIVYTRPTLIEKTRPQVLWGKRYDSQEAIEIENQLKRDHSSPQGDDYSTVSTRMKEALEEIKTIMGIFKEFPVVVSHSQAIKTGLAAMIYGDKLLPELVEDFASKHHIQNGGIVIARFNATWEIDGIYNHLPEEE